MFEGSRVDSARQVTCCLAFSKTIPIRCGDGRLESNWLKYVIKHILCL